MSSYGLARVWLSGITLVFYLIMLIPPPKTGLSIIEKCNNSPYHEWRYSHTEHWTTEEPVYGYKWGYDFQTGDFEYKYRQIGTETVPHSRDILACLRNPGR